MTLAERLRAQLAFAPREPLFPGDDPELVPAEAVPAAVLIAVIDRPDPSVVLTVRHSRLRTHAGQIAFPGGRIDPGEDPTRAALREAWEEVGLDQSRVQPIAELDPYATVTGFRVTPVLAVAPAGLALTPRDGEVEAVFEAPLAHLLDSANHRRESRLFQGRERHYYAIGWEGRTIWGATAAMLVNLSRRLRWP